MQAVDSSHLHANHTRKRFCIGRLGRMSWTKSLLPLMKMYIRIHINVLEPANAIQKIACGQHCNRSSRMQQASHKPIG